MAATERLLMLERMYLAGVQENRGLVFSVETLLDVLVVLFDECCSSNLRREKTVTDFVEFGKLFWTCTELRTRKFTDPLTLGQGRGTGKHELEIQCCF